MKPVDLDALDRLRGNIGINRRVSFISQDKHLPESNDYFSADGVLFRLQVGEGTYLLALRHHSQSLVEELRTRRREHDALKMLHRVVTEQNRRGASWHPEIFAEMMQAISQASAALESGEGGK